MATEESRGGRESTGTGKGLFERLSGRLPVISVAVVALVVAGVLASFLLIPGGEPPEPDFPVQLPEPAARTPLATPSAAAIVPDLSQESARLIAEPSETLRFLSSDGGVKIDIAAGSVEEPVSLTFSRLSDFQIPTLPNGFSGTEMAFDLSAFSPEGLSYLDYSFLRPITVAIKLPASLIAAARLNPISVSLQHYEQNEGWLALPAVYDEDSETLTANVSSLSVFALLVQGSVDAGQGPIQGLQPTSTATSEPTPTATTTSSPTPSPTPTPAATRTPSPTPTPVPTATPSPVPTATASATPTSTPTRVAIQAPVLLEPADGANLRDTTPTFVWSPVQGTSSVFYELQIDDGTSFGTTIILTNVGSETSFTISADQRLEVDTYYWRVRAIDGGRLGSFSEIRTLKVRRR